MKKFKILTILFISLFAFNVSAIVDEYGNQSNGSTINIIYDEEGLKVYDGDTRLTDYSEYVEFKGTKTILLKTNINNIEITNPEFVISTNKKTISINDFYAHEKIKVPPRPGAEPEPDNNVNYIGYFDAAFIVFERGYTKQASNYYNHGAVRFDGYEINILNSSIECNDDYLDLGATSMYIEHSGIYARSIGNEISKTIIKDATIGVENTYGKVYLDNSSLETYGMTSSSSLYATNMSKIKTTVGGTIRHLILDNSEFEYIYDGGDLPYRPIEIDGRFSIHNSKFTIDFEEYNGSNSPKLEFDNDNYKFDDNMIFVDSSGRALYKKTWNADEQCVSISPDIMDEEYSFHSCESWTAATYVYDNEFGESPKTLSIASVVEVRLKVNGTWADGTTDDIVIFKPAFSTISYTDIPVGKMTLDDFENGDWDTKPVNAVLEENKNVVLTLTLSNTKEEEVKGIEDNPKTGLFNDILLFIPVIISILGFNYLKRLELFKKM